MTIMVLVSFLQIKKEKTASYLLTSVRVYMYVSFVSQIHCHLQFAYDVVELLFVSQVKVAKLAL